MMTGMAGSGTEYGLQGQYAGFMTRLAAFVIDTFALSASIVFLSWFLRTSFSMFQVATITQLTPILQRVYAFILSPLFGNLASLGFIVIYYVFFWSFGGQSIGKAVLGLKIVPMKGGKMTITRSIVRFFGLFISILPFGLGFLWILFDDRRSAWHDHLAKTCVVYNWDARPDENFLVDAIKQIKNRQKINKGK